MLINAEPKFSDYAFLRLFACVSVLHGKVILENHQLEQDLFSISKNLEYHDLFGDIAKREDAIFPEHSYVSLSCAFQTAYAYGLFVVLDQRKLKSIICISPEEARDMLQDFDQEKVEKMFRLYEDLQHIKENKKKLTIKKVLEPKI